MKKIIFLLMLFVACSFAYASIDASYECEKKSCVEGSIMHWTVPVFNNINKTIIVEYIRLVDENSLSVAFYDAERNKTFAPGEIYIYKFDQLIVAPPSGYTWYYEPCMRVRLEGSNSSEFICKDAVKTFSVIPKDKAQCSTNSDCAVNEKCDEYTLKCVSLNCMAGEAVKDHSCVAENEYAKIPSITRMAVLAAIILAVIVVIIVIAAIATKPKVKNKKNKKKGKKQKE